MLILQLSTNKNKYELRELLQFYIFVMIKKAIVSIFSSLICQPVCLLYVGHSLLFALNETINLGYCDKFSFFSFLWIKFAKVLPWRPFHQLETSSAFWVPVLGFSSCNLATNSDVSVFECDQYMLMEISVVQTSFVLVSD